MVLVTVPAVPDPCELAVPDPPDVSVASKYAFLVPSYLESSYLKYLGLVRVVIEVEVVVSLSPISACVIVSVILVGLDWTMIILADFMVVPVPVRDDT